MKKLLIAAAACAFMAAPAYAEGLNAAVVDGEIIIERVQDMNENVVAACYDEAGKLVYANGIKAAEDKYRLTVPESCELIKIYDIGVKSYEVIIEETVPEETATPKPTLNPAYEKEADAACAFAVVEKTVSSINEDNEEGTLITCFYQGQKITVFLTDETLIKSAPKAFGYLKGETAISLKEGDVIYFATNPSRTKVTGMYLIYRPTNVFEESSFYNCFTDSGLAGGLWSVVPYGGKSPSGRYTYAFGIVTDKYETSMTLYSHTGLAQDAVDIDFTDDTVTYICDMEGKPELEVSRVAGISKTWISKSDRDEDDNITYSDDYSYSLALVRLVDDVAADIVVYQNVEF